MKMVATEAAIEPVKSGTYNPIFNFTAWLINGVVAVETWRRRHKASMQGARLESRVLRDLGITEAQRFIEVNKPFWEK